MSSGQQDFIGYKPGQVSEARKDKNPGNVERRYKVGVHRGQGQLIGYELEDFIDYHNPVRAIDAYVDSLDLRELGFTNTVANSNCGQPAYSPDTLLKLYLYGYQNRIRSTRNLARECLRNVEVMWLLERLSPEYRTIGSFRAANAGAIRKVHRQFIRLCRHLELLSDDRISVDGSHFKGNVSSKSFRKADGLIKRNAQIDKEIEEWHKQIEKTDELEDKRDDAPKSVAALAEILEVIQKLNTEKQRNEHFLTQLEETGFSHISLTDTDAQRMSKQNKSCQGYNVQIAVEGKNRIIVADEVTNRANDREELFNLAEQARKALGAYKLDVLADQGYSSGKQFKQCYDNDITPYVPIMKPRSLIQGEQRYKTSEFAYDKERNVYVCPTGQLLYPSGKPAVNGTQKYCSRKASCDHCVKRERCLTKKGSNRQLHRSEHEELIAMHKEHMEAHPEAMRERASMVEHPFGTIKVRAGWTHFLVRGMEKVTGEWSLMALGYNLTRVLNVLGMEKFKEYCSDSRSLQSI